MTKAQYAKLVKYVDRSKLLLEGEGPTFKHIYEMCTDSPRKKAVTYFDEDDRIVSYNYAKYREYAGLYASQLMALFDDLPRGSLIGLKMRNTHLWVYLFWGILASGHAPLLLDYRLDKEKTSVLLKEAGAKALIANEEEEYEVPLYRLKDLRQKGQKEPKDWWDKIYLCTSGTTGNSRIMEYCGEDFCHQILAAINVPKESTTLMSLGEINILAMIPLNHIFGLVAVIMWFTFYQKNLVYPSSISSKDLVYAIKKGKCTHVFSVPMLFDSVANLVNRSMEQKGGKLYELYQKMSAYNRGEISKKEAGFIASSRFFNNLIKKKVVGTAPVYLISGGSYLSEDTLKTITGLGYPLYNGIGMTEVGITSVELSPDPLVRLKGSVGHAFHGVDYKVAPDGELLIKSPFVHKEEIVGGKIQKTVLDEEGYFHSGDLVEMDDDGRVYIKGRAKETIINSDGENIYPDELEERFKGLKGALRISILGIRRKKNSKEEEIALVYEPSAGIEDEETKKDFLRINATVSKERRVNKIYKALKALPLANGIKVKRLEVAKEIEAGSKDFIDLFGEGHVHEDLGDRLAAYDPEKVDFLLKGIEELFEKALVLTEGSVQRNSDFGADLGGDSMSYVAMVADFNTKYQVELPENLYGQLLTPEDFALYLLEGHKA